MTRDVSFSDLARRSVFIWFGAIFLLAGAAFSYSRVTALFREIRFDKESSEIVEGVVMVLTQGSKGKGRDHRTIYHVSYRFTFAGASYENRSTVNKEIGGGLHERGPVRIQVLSGDPQINRVAGSEDLLVGELFFGGAFVAMGGILIVMGLRRVFLEIRLNREGVSVEATVTDVKATDGSRNRAKDWVVCYTYRDHQGQTHEAESWEMSPDEAETWKVGDTGRARFDPRKPEKGMWTGREE